LDRIETDVCIVGAGYAGLTAARRVTQAGMAAIVLEARGRVGGRVWTRQMEDGTALDMGGTWLGPGQDAAYGLAQELKISTYPTYATGETVFVDAQGRVRGYRGSISPIGPLPIASLGQGMFRLDAMARSVSLDAPWKGKHARNWDSRSIGSWIDAQVPTRTAKRLLSAAVRGLLTANASEVSLLQFLHLVRSARGGLSGLLAIEGGYQQDRLTGGAQSLANVMSEELGEAVHLNTPVREIDQDEEGVTIHGEDLTVRLGERSWRFHRDWPGESTTARRCRPITRSFSTACRRARSSRS
jgi:monoamine oxidase